MTDAAHDLPLRLYPPRSLPGTWIDLIRDGVKTIESRRDVVQAVRNVMLGAHRAGRDWAEMHAFLADDRNRLAVQFKTGYGGRTISTKQRDELLAKLWSDTRDVVARTPTRTPEEVDDHLEAIHAELEGADLSPRRRVLLQCVVTLATQHRTLRPTVPVRALADMAAQRGLDLSPPTVHRELARICTDGEWLALAQRGSRTRANLFHLAPMLVQARSRAATPERNVNRPDTSLTPQSEAERAAVRALLNKLRNPTEAGVPTHDAPEVDHVQCETSEGARDADPVAEPLPASTFRAGRSDGAALDNRGSLDGEGQHEVHPVRPAERQSDGMLGVEGESQRRGIRPVQVEEPETPSTSSRVRAPSRTDPRRTGHRPQVREQAMREPGPPAGRDQGGEHPTVGTSAQTQLPTWTSVDTDGHSLAA